MSRTRGTFSPFTRGNASPRPDFGNRYYVRGGGGNNPRGTRGGGPFTRSTSGYFPPEADIKEGLDTSKIIETIPSPPRQSAPEHIPIENTRYVASYNWVAKEEPTIVVPGSPALWTGQDLPFTLQPDDGSNFVDQNTARMSRYPLLPLFAAADAIHDKKAPPVDWPAVDVVTDRNGLRKLLRWLSPSEGREVRDFRIDVELVGLRTIILNRWDGRTREPPSGRSFGFAFEADTSRAAPGCPISGHHRAITYDMLDMKMIVRFEVDSCLPTDKSDTKRSAKEVPVPAVDDLADALGSISLSSSSTAASESTSSSSSSPAAIHILHVGTQVPQDALLEVASRSTYFVNQLDWNELYPQLALSQTPGLRLGVHERGKFTELRELQVIGGADTDAGGGSDGDSPSDGGGAASWPPNLGAQRRETAAQVVRLARVLEDIQELAISRGPGPAGCFSLVCESGKLRVYGRKGARSCLPSDVRARFSSTGACADVDA